MPLSVAPKVGVCLSVLLLRWCSSLCAPWWVFLPVCTMVGVLSGLLPWWVYYQSCSHGGLFLLLHFRVWVIPPVTPQGVGYSHRVYIPMVVILPVCYSQGYLSLRRTRDIKHRKPGTESSVVQGVHLSYTPVSLLEEKRDNTDTHPFHCWWWIPLL